LIRVRLDIAEWSPLGGNQADLALRSSIAGVTLRPAP
jgi:hypothetical protein